MGHTGLCSCAWCFHPSSLHNLTLSLVQPQELVPYHPVHNVQDWDAPAGAISWARLVTFLKHVKETGEIPSDHRSHDHLNEQKVISVEDTVRDRWRAEFEKLKKERTTSEDERIVWGLVDGFLLYWHPVRFGSFYCLLDISA